MWRGARAFSSETLLMLLITLTAYLLYELITTKKLRNLLPALPVFLVVLGIDAIIGGSLLLSGRRCSNSSLRRTRYVRSYFCPRA